MFVDNKYTTWYWSIISNAKSLNRSRRQGYFERHHIIPKSLGGTDLAENLVLLTAREHYVCHLLLTKMLDGNHKDLMVFACIKLSGGSWYLPEGVIRSRSYEYVRRLSAEASSRRLKGVPKSQHHRENLKAAFSHSVCHRQAAKQNAKLAHETNKGKTRPNHSTFMSTLNRIKNNEQFAWHNKRTNETFVGSRIELHDKYPELRLDELWKVAKGKARSHKGWTTTQLHLLQSSPEVEG